MSKTQEQNPNYNPTKVAVYSALATMLGDMVMYPIDTIGTRIKAHKTEFLNFRQGYRLVQNEGFRMFYKGFSTTILGSFLPYGTYFMLYEYLNKQAMKLTAKLNSNEKFKHINLLIPLLTAPIAEAASVITYIPFDTVRTRMQMNTSEYNYKGAFDGLKQIYNNEGILRLFMASHVYMVQMIIFTGLQFWFFEMGRFYFMSSRSKYDTNKQLKLSESISVTVAATLLAGFLVNPLDLLITRFQLVDSSKEHLSFIKILKDLLQNEGKKALFKGLGARLTQSCLFSLFYLPAYDYFKTKYGIILDV